MYSWKKSPPWYTRMLYAGPPCCHWFEFPECQGNLLVAGIAVIRVALQQKVLKYPQVKCEETHCLSIQEFPCQVIKSSPSIMATRHIFRNPEQIVLSRQTIVELSGTLYSVSSRKYIYETLTGCRGSMDNKYTQLLQTTPCLEIIISFQIRVWNFI